MRKYLLFCFLLSTLGLFAQPNNDDCGGIIDLGVGISCTETIYNNVDASPSTIFSNPSDNIPSCWNVVNQDVWFMFTVPADGSLIDYTITIEGVDDGAGTPSLTNPQIALYRGDCGLDNLAELLCESAELGETSVSLDAALLTPTIPYFIRVDNFSSSGTIPQGAFQVCVDSIMIENNIDEGTSTACAGVLFDSGGATGDYSSNENNVFTICPSALSNSIHFTMDFYNIEAIGDNLSFFDGTGITGTPLGSLTAGGTCFETCAASGCLTVQFTSDGTVNFEGFEGSWECSIEPCSVPEPIIVNENITNQDIIQATASPLTQVTISSINCADESIGTFESPENSNLGLERGLILSSGFVANAPGPNNGFGNNASSATGTDGDADLDYLSSLGSGEPSNDACVVELDVFVNTNELTFEYIFASEEYPEFVNSEFNDIFAFLASGPGITGDPNIANQENIAIIPNTNIPVEINSVNDEENWQYYRNNTNGLSLNYDGMTSDVQGGKKSLTAKIQTIPCNTYHLKLAVADRGNNDRAFDSAVFISDIKAGVPIISSNFGSGLDMLIEGCTVGTDEIIISVDSEIVDTVTYEVMITGSATPNVDYVFNIPSTITFLPGQTSFAFPIAVTPDVIPEDAENIIISLTSDFGCGIVQAASLDIPITDNPVVEINGGIDSVFVCATEGVELSVEGAQFYFWEPVSVFDDPSSATPVATITQSQWVTVTGSVSNCIDTDSIFLELVDPEVTIIAQTPTDVCAGTPVILEAINNVNGQGLTWTPEFNINSTTAEVVTVTPNFPTMYTASIAIANCIVSDQIQINVDLFDFPNLTTTDTTLCEGELLTLADPIPFTTTTYDWTPGIDIMPDSTIAGPTVIPLEDEIYTVVATSQSGFCRDSATVNVEVIPAEINIMPRDTAFICLGETANISATTTSNNILWSSVDTLINGTTNLSFMVDPTVSTWYFASMSIGDCTVNDSVLVRVDSLPDMPIMAMPEPSYCEGDIVTLVSPIYEPVDYPNIEHLWSPAPGAESDEEDYNLVFNATETITYVRSTTNNACFVQDTIAVEVFPIEVINVIPPQPLICLGESVSLDSDADTKMLSEIMWMPAVGLSCIDCADPVASPPATTSYSIMATQENGCPAMGSVTIEVATIPSIIFPDIDQCIGASVNLNLAPAEPGTTYTWSSPDDPSFSSNDANPMVTLNQNITYEFTADNGICPPISDDVALAIVQEPTFSVSPNDVTICSGDEVTLDAISSGPGTYTWTPGPDNSSIVVTPSQTTNYTSTFTWGPNCGTFTGDVLVTVEGGFNVFIEANPNVTTINQGETVSLSAAVNPSSTEVTSYAWFANDNPIGTNSPTLTDQPFENPTNYTVVATSANGCTSQTSFLYEVIPPIWEIPSAFTPNGDSRNDVFNLLSNGEINMRSFNIYNRWGQKVFTTNDPDVGWDGTHNGSMAPSDVYVYVIILDLLSGERILKGDVTLIR